jgi:hypothetical protein
MTVLSWSEDGVEPEKPGRAAFGSQIAAELGM